MVEVFFNLWNKSCCFIFQANWELGRELAGTMAISFVALYRARNATASLQLVNYCVRSQE